MTEWMVRKARRADADALAELEARAFGPASWGREAVRGGLTAPYVTALLAAAAPDGPAEGFAFWRQLVDEAELLTIGVVPERRRLGMAGALLRGVLKEARQAKVERVFLEVDDGNDAAIGLYRKAGFEPFGRRRGYYRNGADAIVMRKTL